MIREKHALFLSKSELKCVNSGVAVIQVFTFTQKNTPSKNRQYHSVMDAMLVIVS